MKLIITILFLVTGTNNLRPDPYKLHLTPSIKTKQVEVLSKKDFDCLCRIIRAEGEGEGLAGKVEIAKTVLLRSEKRGKTICHVISEKKQFCGYKTVRYNMPITASCQMAAKLALQRYFIVKEESYFYFFNPSTAKCGWMKKKAANATSKLRIGHHLFFN